MQAGIIDHAIDSTVWCGLAIVAFWCACNLQTSLDLRSFVVAMVSQFPLSMAMIGLMLTLDLWLCLSRGQSFGQFLGQLYKHREATAAAPLAPLTFWLHGLISRCLGLPLLWLGGLVLLCINPTIHPLDLQDFSLLDPTGAARLVLFLLKIIGVALLLFALSIPIALGFYRQPLPTWYDRLLGVHILVKPKQRNERHARTPR